MRTALYLLTLLILLSSSLQAQPNDTAKTNQKFELSFGQALLFISDSKIIDIHKQHAVVVPTSAVLFFVEFRPQKKTRIPVFLNLPTETKQFVVNGQLINEESKPVVGFGLQFRVFRLKIDKRSRLELEAGPLASFLLTKNTSEIFSPIVAGRLRVNRGENFVMYFGSTYAIGINTWGILYGTGTVF
jgi:hypothetical protein